MTSSDCKIPAPMDVKTSTDCEVPTSVVQKASTDCKVPVATIQKISEDCETPVSAVERTSAEGEVSASIVVTTFEESEEPVGPDNEVDPVAPKKDPPYYPRIWKFYWDQKIKGSPWLGSFNIICSVVGVGIFGLPYAMAQSGWVGIPLLLFTYCMSTFTCAILGDVFTAANGAKSFADLGDAAFGATGRWLVNIAQYVTMIGVASVYVVTIASGMGQVFPDVFPNCSANIAIFGAVLAFHIVFHKLNEVAVLSAFNLAVAITITVVVCSESVRNAIPNTQTLVVNTAHDDYTYEIFIAFPNIAFAFGCQFILPPIYEELKDKSTFKPMCHISMLPTLLMYIPVAVLGYWAFGNKVEDPVFKNFSGSAINMVIILLVVHLLMSYAIIMNPAELAFEELVVRLLSGRAPIAQALLRGCNRCNRWPLRIVLRLLLTGLTVLIAWAIPCFSILLSLVSSLSATAINFVFPLSFYLKLVPGINLWKKLFCYFCLLFSVAGGVGGMYNAILGIRTCQPSSGGC
eukprot:EG_transcript_5738